MKNRYKDDALEGRFYFDTVSSIFLGTSFRNFISNPLIYSKSELPEDKFSVFYQVLYIAFILSLYQIKHLY